MQSIDPSELASVTGGGHFMAGLQRVLGFFQSEGFQQILGGLQGLIGSFAGLGQAGAQQGAPQGAAPAAGPAQGPAAQGPAQGPTAQG